MKKYTPSAIEPKWQKRWAQANLYYTDLSEVSKRYYILVELPYTSGDLHIGHWFTFSKGDILARFKRMQGYNVIFPNGYDTFGLPAENAAIRNGMHPRDWTLKNIRKMRAQFETMGTAIDWSKTATTCDPSYYKWNQWIFLRMLERGIAYKGSNISNWCPSCQTVLADENVESGKCWRCATEVEKKPIEQWFLKITNYADELIWKESEEYDWPKSLKDAQNKWIGRSEGAEIEFRVENSEHRIRVFTVFPETIYGVTYMVLAPEHPLVDEITTKNNFLLVSKYKEIAQKKSEQERKEGQTDKTGVFTGAYCVSPVNGKKVPVWVADYVISSYGTGAVMGVPGSDQRDFEFAKKYGLEVIRVVGKQKDDQSAIRAAKEVLEEGFLANSDKFSGLKSPDPAREKILYFLEQEGFGKREVTYHLHDWSISRQRYWGTPIPVIYCDACGIVPVPDADLPVVLPEKVDYAPKGKAPLATALDWVKVECPKCKKIGRREVETMDGFIDNSWYFFRYLDPDNEKEIFDKKIIDSWMPIEIYIGGGEHTYGHALYSRFLTKFFKDIGLVEFDEYTKKRIHHGVILGPDSFRMSKSRGNVVNPDEQAAEYGADAVRTYLSFLGPFDIVTPWNPDGLFGIYHFIQRVWGLQEKLLESELSLDDLAFMHKTIKKVTVDLEALANNTAIAALMEWLNYLSRKPVVSKDEYKTFLLLLAPLAPHITDELWEIIGEYYVLGSIHKQKWPSFEEKYLRRKEVTIPVQVNGRVRELLVIPSEMLNNKNEIEKLALKSKKVQKFLGNSTLSKIVYVPGKIINIVV